MRLPPCKTDPCDKRSRSTYCTFFLYTRRKNSQSSMCSRGNLYLCKNSLAKWHLSNFFASAGRRNTWRQIRSAKVTHAKNFGIVEWNTALGLCKLVGTVPLLRLVARARNYVRAEHDSMVNEVRLRGSSRTEKTSF